ncbi:SDR family oxidoreductase [Thalassorhabdomicrobium marinisediminis]|uniref:Short-chain dehydrogenase n=1 Tax=Thalassorhabdomicrobium marinisediminis TaxID=2170577 RepID=A0A2T7G066_9RHOB|nr:SDR family oxidoreductase [Thalassorhabdomicrobium marinisediminis]PVA07807.1 short-chain dehydrogenase [Thalassorhabdomicrobium marinisediminis]
MDMTGKVVIVTGASRGIGAAAARAFAEAGAKVALMARSSGEIDALAGEIGEAALSIACDVSDYTALAAAVAATEDAFGGIDVMVNNAGLIDPISPLAEADPEAWGTTIDVNLKGVFNGMRAVLPGMIERGGGTILTISSGAAHGPVEAWSAYCASKAGAYMLTRAADHENRAKGLRIMGLSPGTVATDMQREIKASGVNPVSQLDWSDHVPPEWPARALVWMCSPEADAHLGTDVSLRDEGIRKQVGLT